MDWLRRHWFDAGAALALLVLGGVALAGPALSPLAAVLWISLATLFLHQFEEYRFPGTFPGMMNLALSRSDHPERYPLNAQTALVVNVGVGWTSYLLAALFAERAIWLGIATILVSFGNVVAHTLLFPIRGRLRYNAGAFTAVILFLPVIAVFFRILIASRVASPLDWGAGAVLGVLLNGVGIVMVIEWMKDPNSPFAFDRRMIPRESSQERTLR